MTSIPNLDAYVSDFQKQIDDIIGHVSLDEQIALTEKATVLLGDNLTDENYLATLKQLAS